MSVVLATASPETARRPTPDGLSDPARLDALRAAGLLDTDPEEAFDRAVRLATNALGAPISLLALVDSERQFFKAQIGLSGAAAEDRQTPLTHSFCQHVVLRDEPLVIEDAREHPMVRDNLAIRDLDVVAYLGVPVRAPDGHVLGSLCAIEPVPRAWTEAEVATLRDIAGGVESEIALRAGARERTWTREALENERARLSHVLESTSDGVVALDRDWRVTYSNRRFAELTRTEGDPTGRVLWDLFPEAVGNAFWRDYHEAMDEGEPRRTTAHYPPLGRWFEADARPSAEGLTIFFRDVTAERHAEEARQLLVRELHHRIKNLFAIVTSLIAMTARTAASPQDMARTLRGRLMSLAQAHELIRPALTAEAAGEREVSLPKLLATILEPHLHADDARLSLDGPTLHVSPNAATHLALVAHELATNAAKYGALSGEGGCLRIEWRVADGTVHLVWHETDGPERATVPGDSGGEPVGGAEGRAPEGGFGSKLVRLSVCTQLEGTLDTTWETRGVRLAMAIPLRRLER